MPHNVHSQTTHRRLPLGVSFPLPSVLQSATQDTIIIASIMIGLAVACFHIYRRGGIIGGGGGGGVMAHTLAAGVGKLGLGKKISFRL